MSLNCLGTDLPHTPPGLLFAIRDAYYLVFCPEGTQRYCSESGYHVAKTGRLKVVVLPSIAPPLIMGFPGLYLSLCEAALKEHELIILCPSWSEKKWIESWWTASFRFLKTDKRSVRLKFLESTFSDSNIQFDFFLDSQKSNSSFFREKEAANSVQPVSPTPPRRYRLYVTLPERPSTFDCAKATLLGLRKGRKYGLLKKGLPVQSDLYPQQLILPHQVLGKPFPPQRILISDSPHPTKEENKNMSCIELLIDMSGGNHSDGPEHSEHRIVQGNEPMSNETTIWFLHREKTASCFQTSSAFQRLFNSLDSQIFPYHDASTEAGRFFPETEILETREKSHRRFILFPGLRFNLYATRHVQPGTTLDELKGRNRPIVDLKALPCELRNDFQRILITNKGKENALNENRNFPQLYVLGSGCATPSLFRNVSCNLLRFQLESENILAIVDCGEGSLGQLRRMTGLEHFFKWAQKIFFFVTHGHADHHLGLWSFLSEIIESRKHARTLTPVWIYTPLILKPYMNILQAFLEKEEDVFQVFFQILPSEGGRIFSWASCVRVNHPADAYGYIFFIDGTKIVFSGDTRPCSALVREGKGADWLIHEATFLPSEEEDARLNCHSTVEEALDCRNKMGAKYCLLTHISQRYAKNGDAFFSYVKDVKTGFAVDLIRIKLPLGIPRILCQSILDKVSNFMLSFRPKKDEIEVSRKDPLSLNPKEKC